MNQSNGKARPQTSKQVTQKRKRSGAPTQVGQKRQKTGLQKQVSVASAYATGQSIGKARYFQNSVDSCRIVHRELVTSVTGSVAFAVASTVQINPGLPLTFPWLSVQAQGWEKYKFNKLRFCSYTRTASTTPGSLILAVDYDAADSAPVNEQIASSYYSTQEDAPWKDICVDLDPKRLAEDRYIRTGALSSNLDIKTYDVGNLHVCTIDGTAVAWSKLWVEYDITLMNPQLPSAGAAGAGALAGATAQTAAAPFGTAAVATGSYNLSSATNVISFSGLSIGTEYCFDICITGTVITACTPAATTGITQKTNMADSCVNAAATLASCSQTFTATATSGTYTLTVTATTVTAARLVVCALTPAPSF